MVIIVIICKVHSVQNCAESSASYHSIGNISRHQVADIEGPGAHGQWDNGKKLSMLGQEMRAARSPPVGTLALAGHPLVVVHLEGPDLTADDRHHRHHRE